MSRRRVPEAVSHGLRAKVRRARGPRGAEAGGAQHRHDRLAHIGHVRAWLGLGLGSGFRGRGRAETETEGEGEGEGGGEGEGVRVRVRVRVRVGCAPHASLDETPSASSAACSG